MRNDQDYFVILYDVADDARRGQLFKLLEGYGGTFQFSVFEARLDARQFVELRHAILDLIDDDKDKVAILRLCDRCRRRAELLGRQASVICKNVVIV